MNSSETELKKLLKNAEEKIESLVEENRNLSQSFYDLMEAQKAESEQMVQLTEQVWSLEEALSQSREKALEQIAAMKSKLETMNDYMQDTLDAARKKASRVELAARVYEMSKATNLNDIDQKMAEFNEQLQPGKLK